MKNLTKVYPTGVVTLDASQFPEIRQETIDREIRSFGPFAAAVKRLNEYEETYKNGKH